MVLFKVNPIRTLACRACGFFGPGEVPAMVIITLDIHIWPDGVASVSYTFALLTILKVVAMVEGRAGMGKLRY